MATTPVSILGCVGALPGHPHQQQAELETQHRCWIQKAPFHKEAEILQCVEQT